MQCLKCNVDERPENVASGRDGVEKLTVKAGQVDNLRPMCRRSVSQQWRDLCDLSAAQSYT